MFYNMEKELGEDAMVAGSERWWEEFWVAHSDVAHKIEWRNSVYLNIEEGPVVERWFYESVKRLHEKTGIFLKEYGKMKYEEKLREEK